MTHSRSMSAVFLGLALLALISDCTADRRSVREHPIVSGCGKVLWLTGFQMKTSSGASAFYVAENSEYVDALKVAILSAREQAPSLVPVVVFTGPRSPEQSALEKWLHRHDALTIHHTLSFQNDMDLLGGDPTWAFSQNVLGSWLRVDVPNVLDTLWNCEKTSRIPKVLKENIGAVDREYILWTDPDVIFRGDIDSCTLPKPRVLSVGPEFRMGWPENYGVIYFNGSGYAAGLKDLIDWARQQKFHFNHDQHLFATYWGTAVTVLPDGMNWKPYWGNASTAIPGQFEHGQIKIIHFHGPKLSTAICFIDLTDEDGRTGKLLADLLAGAHSRDGGYFYKELSNEYQTYLDLASSTMMSGSGEPRSQS